MLQVDNFLIVFSLEVGGQFIGWFGLISNSIVLPLAVMLLIGICIDKDLQFIREQLEGMDIHSFQITDDKSIKNLREYIIMMLLLIIIISTIYLVASAMLLRGTKNRNHRQIKPAKNILAFLAIFSAFGLIMRLSINSMINAVIYIYVFAVIYSLWKKIKNEEESGERPDHNQQQQFYPIANDPKV